jgi:hypothetical protein
VRIAPLYVVMLVGGCNWILGLDHIDPPNGDANGDGRPLDAVPPPDTLQFEDCRGKIAFTAAPFLFPGFAAVSAPAIRGDLQEAYDLEDDLNGTHIHRWVVDGSMMFGAADASPLDTGTEQDPSLSADGREIVFISVRSGADYIYLSERAEVDRAWGTPIVVPGLATVLAQSVALSPDGLALYFVDGANDMYQAERTDRGLPFALANNQNPVASNIVSPTLSADGLELISETNPPDTGGLFEQVRDSKLQVFGGVVAITLPGLPAYDADLSADNHILLTGNKRFFVRSCQ